jgi:hypothetical protein
MAASTDMHNNAATQSQRLKDTCDMCSASKVRCDKIKPVCGRCKRLEYPCFYSPARRIPKRPNHQSTESSSAGQHQVFMRKRVNLSSSSSASSPPSSQSTSETNDEYEFQKKAKKNQLKGAKEDSTLISSQHAPENIAMHNLEGHVLPDRSHAEFQFEAYDTLMGMNPTFNAHATDQGHASLIGEMHNQQYLPESSEHNNGYSHNKNGLFAMGQTQMKATADIQTIDRMVLDHDCATIAMHVLSCINNDTMKYSSENMSTQDTEVAHQLSILSQSTQTSSAIFIKRISSILICPCSKKIEVALLAAAACNAFLDQFELIIYYIKILSSPSISPESNGSAGIPKKGRKKSTTSTGLNSQGPPAPQANRGPNHDNTAMMQVLDQLPRVANLIAQFGKRYDKDNDPVTWALIDKLAMELKDRLRRMIDEATDWVAQV